MRANSTPDQDLMLVSPTFFKRPSTRSSPSERPGLDECLQLLLLLLLSVDEIHTFERKKENTICERGGPNSL